MRTCLVPSPLRRPVALLLSLAAMVAGLVLPDATAARADTGHRRVSFTYMNITSYAGMEQRIAWRNLIASIQNAAGHHFGEGVYETQAETEALVSVRLYHQNTWVRLWIEPHNLYLRGYTNRYGTFMADDAFHLRNRLATYPQNPNPDQNVGFVYSGEGGGTLPFASDYPDLERVAQRTRQLMPLSYHALWDSFNQLAQSQNPWTADGRRATARSYLFFTQWISEAARLDDIYNDVAAFMGDPGWSRDGLSDQQVAWEQNWWNLSWFARESWLWGAVPPLHVGAIILWGWFDVPRRANMIKHI